MTVKHFVRNIQKIISLSCGERIHLNNENSEYLTLTPVCTLCLRHLKDNLFSYQSEPKYKTLYINKINNFIYGESSDMEM